MNRASTIAGDRGMRARETDNDRNAMDRYRRCVNYLAAAQIYLRANPLLEEPLRPDHIKDRLLGTGAPLPESISCTCTSIGSFCGQGPACC